MIFAAEKSNPELVNFLVKNAGGLICVPVEEQRLQELDLHMMTEKNTALHDTAFTVSVDHKFGTTTGISAFDRDNTIKALIKQGTKPEDLARPGHVFPLKSVVGGVLRRAGHTEAAVDLAKLAGLYLLPACFAKFSRTTARGQDCPSSSLLRRNTTLRLLR